MDTQAPTSPRYLHTLPAPVANNQPVSRQTTEVLPFDGKEVRQRSETKLEVPPTHSHKKPKADKPLEGRHSKKTDDKTKHPKHNTGAKDKEHSTGAKDKEHSTKDKAKKEDTGKHSSKPGFFSESHFGIRDNLSKGFHQIFQLLGLEAPAASPGNEAAAIQETIQSSGHTSPLLVVNNALFYLVNTIDNRFFGDKIPDTAVNTVRDIVGKIVEHVNLHTLPAILNKTQKAAAGDVSSPQAPASLQDIINATKQDNAIAESLPKALEAITGVTGLKPKSLGMGDKIQLSFNHAKLNLVKAIELIKEILRSDLHLGTLLLDLIPHFAQSSFAEHKAEKAERLDWN